MPQYSPVPSNTFVGGLLTEAGELTFPENASVDETNCDLLKDGSRRRRLGLSIESGGQLSTETISANSIVTTHLWKNVGEQAGVEFVVVQIGDTLIFYDQTDGSALSANRVDTTYVSGVEYSLDLGSYERPGGNGASSAPIQVASLKGALIVASPEINTLYIERDITTGAFTVTEIEFLVRDYAWQGDNTTYTEEIAIGSVTDARIYDTKNSGWSDGPNNVGDSALTTYLGGGNYPPLTHPWYSGKNSSGAFSVSEWEEVYSGTTLITNGHYVLDLYSKDRQTAAGLGSSALNTTESARFSCIASYAGRVFYSGMSNSTDDNGSKIYFSQQIIQGFSNLGFCHQVNDPVSEELSDLLDTDGGFITIPEAHNIKALHTFGPDLYVFAENGVWRIGGVEDVFRANNFTVSKLTEDGVSNASSLVSAQGRPYWWSNSGIFTLQPNQLGTFVPTNISVSTIQTFWDDITAAKRDLVRGVYDASSRRVMWFYPSLNEDSEIKKNEVLIFDEVLKAFFPWTISDQESNTDYVVDVVFSSGIGLDDISFNVINSSGDQVQDSSNDDVVANLEGRSLYSSRVKVLVVDGATGSVTFAEFTDSNFYDWGDANFQSYAEAAYNFLGDLETRKTVPYVTSYLKTTETGWEEDGSGGYTPVRDSSCLLKAYWSFRKEPITRPQQTYLRKYPIAADPLDLSTFEYPTTVIISRLKIRGRGRVVRLRWESEEGKDFHLLGWNMLAAGVGRF